jgi:uncharacterized protein
MSPSNSNSIGRDFDAIHRAQRAHEPSMEEILASIRNIIAEEPAKTVASEGPQPGAAPAPQIDHPRPGAAPRSDGASLHPSSDENTPRVVWRRPQAVENEPASDASQSDAEPLLSPEAVEAVGLSLGALSGGLEARSAALADSMVRDMLRPMLKAWLDENLPATVERLVREEIQRIARGRK